jgi:hypothetical protein
MRPLNSNPSTTKKKKKSETLRQTFLTEDCNCYRKLEMRNEGRARKRWGEGGREEWRKTNIEMYIQKKNTFNLLHSCGHQEMLHLKL